MIGRFRLRSDFARNLTTMLSGTTLAQAIPIAASPILTRLYSPEDFGLFALFSSIVIVLSVMASGRYSMAILLPKLDRDALNVLGLSLLIASLFCLTILLIVSIFYAYFMTIDQLQDIGRYLFLIPVTVFLVAVYDIFYNWTNRHKRYKNLAISKVTQATTTASVAILLGVKSFQSSGLIIAQVVSQFFATLYIVIVNRKVVIWSDISRAKMQEQLSRHVSFPKYDIPAAFLNTFSLQLPIFMLGFLFSPAVVGLFVLSRRIVGLPITVLASSVTTVFKQRAASDFNRDGNCRYIYVKTFKMLLMVATVPSAILLVFAPEIFSFVFGEAWSEAGVYTQILIPMFFLRFVSSPLSYMFYILNKQKANMLGQGILLICVGLSLWVGYVVDSVTVALALFSGVFSIFYIIYLYLSYGYAKGKC